MRQNNARSVSDSLDRTATVTPPDAQKENDSIELEAPAAANWRVYIIAYNRLLRETLGKLLSKRTDLQVVGQSAATTDAVTELVNSSAIFLLLNPAGVLNRVLFWGESI